MPVNQNRYRYVDFIGGRILESRELNTLQTIVQGLSLSGTQTSYGQDAVYRQGAMMNANITVSGSTVTISSADGVNPVLVFVRDRWEAFTTGELTTTTLTGSQTLIYLNWQLALITSAQDSTLVDGATGNPTAEMGQLELSISTTDTSTASITATQLAINTTTIVLVQLNLTSGVYTVVPLSNVLNNALANANTAGLVSLTTNTSGGVAVSTDDSRMINTRTPTNGTVEDQSVRTPVGVTSGGSPVYNADGTPQYSLSTDPGGINAGKIILQASTQRLSDAWIWFVGVFNALLARYNAHEGIVLGLSNTHPFPTASQVGATPISHVGQPLNLVTSHPATVNQSSGGFVVNRTPNSSGAYPSASLDPAYGIFNGATQVASLNHNGDIYSSLANTLTVAPGGATGTVTYTGPIGLISNLATVVRDHVNQVSHANPHGLALTDLGGCSATQEASDVAMLEALIGPPTSLNIVTSSRAWGTVYHNTSGYKMTVYATGYKTGSYGQGFQLSGNVGTSSSQSLVSAAGVFNDGGEVTCIFIVPAGSYYSVTVNTTVQLDNNPQTPVLSAWVEYIN